MVLGIQITVSVIVNEIQTAVGALVAGWMSIGNLECYFLNSNTFVQERNQGLMNSIDNLSILFSLG